MMEVLFPPHPVPSLSPEPRNLEEACREFEALLLERLFEAMDRTVDRSGLFGRSHAQALYRSLWYQALAREIARSGGLGLAERLMEHFGAKVFEGSADKVENPGEGLVYIREGRALR